MKHLLILSLIIVGLTSCNNDTAKQYTCQEYSIDCELKKDNYLLFPLEASSDITDVYGEPIKVNSHWYFVNSKHKVLVPAGINKTNSPYPTVEAFQEIFGSRVKIDTFNISGLKALIVLTGSGEIKKGNCLKIPGPSADLITP